MPKIPTYTAQMGLRQPRGAQFPLNLTALPYQALAEASLQVAQVGQDIREARRATIYSQYIAESANKLQDLALDFQQDADIWTIEERAKKAVEDFKQEKLKEIRDPVIAKNFSFAFDKLALTKMANIVSSARKRQADYNKAQTFAALDALETAYHGSTTQAESALILSQMKGIIQGQAQAGILDYTDAQKEWQKRVSRMAGTEVREDIWENPKEAHKNLVGNKYEGLTDQDRIKYIEMAERRIEAEDREALRILKEKERAEDKDLKDRQTQSELTMWEMAYNGQLDRRWLDREMARRNLRPDAYRAGLKWLETGGSAVNDHGTIATLTDKMLAGQDVDAELDRAFEGGQLRFDTYQSMKKENSARERKQWDEERDEARRYMFEKLDIPAGLLANLNPTEADRKARARELFDIYVDQGKDPWKAAHDVIRSIRPGIRPKMSDLPTPPWDRGRIENQQDLEDAANWVVEAAKNGMSKREVEYWFSVFFQYRDLLEAEMRDEATSKEMENREKMIEEEKKRRGMK